MVKVKIKMISLSLSVIVIVCNVLCVIYCIDVCNIHLVVDLLLIFHHDIDLNCCVCVLAVLTFCERLSTDCDTTIHAGLGTGASLEDVKRE